MSTPKAYIYKMEFEWDDSRSDACFTHRGFDFSHVFPVFFDPNRVVGQDIRWDYGEVRYRLFGLPIMDVSDGCMSLSTPYGVRLSASYPPARQTEKRFYTMSTTRVTIDPDDPATFPTGRVDPAVVDSTTEAKIALHQQQDDAAAMQDMARYARRVRRKLGLTQPELAERIAVSTGTIRNWEQGKRFPSGAARTLLRLLDKSPEDTLRVLS